MPSIDPNDPAYVMSMPSMDPANVLGYTQQYQHAVQQPISRAGWNPQYDVHMPVERDVLNLGEKTNEYGYSLPSGRTWSMYGDEPAGKMMNDYFTSLRKKGGEAAEDERRWSESDQTAYINSRVTTTKRETPVHESVHRGIGKLWDKTFPEDTLTSAENELLTRIWDYRHSNYGKDPKQRKRLEYYITKVSGLETLEDALAVYGAKLDKLADMAIELRKSTDNPQDAMDLHFVGDKPKGKLNAL